MLKQAKKVAFQNARRSSSWRPDRLASLVRAKTLTQHWTAFVAASAGIAPITGPAHFTRFRGDGWQLVTTRPEMSLRIAISLLATLVAKAGPRTRLVIGLGEIDSLAGGDLGAASGSAFLRSGQALDEMSSKRHLAGLGAPAAIAPWLEATLHLIEFISDRWSPPQAEIVAMAVAPGWETQGDLADRLGISRQAVHSRLSGAGYPALASALAAFEGQSWSAAP